MKPITPEPRAEARLVIFAKNQPQYIPLPANVRRPYVETKWRFSWRERLLILLRGVMYLKIMTFAQPLQPLKPTVERESYL